MSAAISGHMLNKRSTSKVTLDRREGMLSETTYSPGQVITVVKHVSSQHDCMYWLLYIVRAELIRLVLHPTS